MLRWRLLKHASRLCCQETFVGPAVLLSPQFLSASAHAISKLSTQLAQQQAENTVNFVPSAAAMVINDKQMAPEETHEYHLSEFHAWAQKCKGKDSKDIETV